MREHILSHHISKVYKSCYHFVTTRSRVCYVGIQIYHRQTCVRLASAFGWVVRITLSRETTKNTEFRCSTSAIGVSGYLILVGSAGAVNSMHVPRLWQTIYTLQVSGVGGVSCPSSVWYEMRASVRLSHGVTSKSVRRLRPKNIPSAIPP